MSDQISDSFRRLVIVIPKYIGLVVLTKFLHFSVERFLL